MSLELIFLLKFIIFIKQNFYNKCMQNYLRASKKYASSKWDRITQ